MYYQNIWWGLAECHHPAKLDPLHAMQASPGNIRMRSKPQIVPPTGTRQDNIQLNKQSCGLMIITFLQPSDPIQPVMTQTTPAHRLGGVLMYLR